MLLVSAAFVFIIPLFALWNLRKAKAAGVLHSGAFEAIRGALRLALLSVRTTTCLLPDRTLTAMLVVLWSGIARKASARTGSWPCWSQAAKQLSRSATSPSPNLSRKHRPINRHFNFAKPSSGLHKTQDRVAPGAGEFPAKYAAPVHDRPQGRSVGCGGAWLLVALEVRTSVQARGNELLRFETKWRQR
jgi:hypothetical protein